MPGEYDTTLAGFDVSVTVSPEDGDNFDVYLYEGGNNVYQVTIPIPGEESEAIESGDIINFAAQAAIDLYEASRGTLGQGGGATEVTAMKRRADCITTEWEDWYLKLKGTPYEEQATTFLSQLVEAYHASDEARTEVLQTHEQERQICKELDMLNLERLKTVDPHQTIIVIGKKAYLYDVAGVQDFLSKFKNCPLEGRAIAKVKELLEARTKLQNLQSAESENWEVQDQLKAAMQELLLQHLQQGVIETSPDTGMESAPAMANDIAELMQSVDLNSPLEPMIAKSKRGISRKEIERMMEKRRRDREEYGDDELEDEGGRRAFEDVVQEVIELGEWREGLDPAESEDELPFEIGDKVTLTKAFENVLHGGGIEKIPSGAAGTIDSLYDGHGDYMLVFLDEGQLVRVPADNLKKSK